MPCSPRTARLLLRDGCAKVIKRDPFTIKLLIGVPGYTQDLTLGIDPGSKFIGSAVRDDQNKVYYLSEVHQRKDVKSNMDQRRMYRRTRRGRKTRYRKPRFLNRKNSIKNNRYPPTLRNKFDTIVKEIAFVYSILPISKTFIEMAKFDIHALSNPLVKKYLWLYQKGVQYGYYNVKAYVLARDKYTCQTCHGKRKDPHLHCHHIIFGSRGGSDLPSNLIVLCETCHDLLHNNQLSLTKKQLSTVKKNLSHATQMNILCSMIRKKFDPTGFSETTGYIAKAIREHFDFPKEHYWDAFFGSFESGNQPELLIDRVLVKVCVAKGEYQRTKGARSEKKMPKRKIQGFCRYDKVLYQNTVCFIKGKMSSGYAKLSDIFGNEIKFKPMAKFTTMKRIGARKSWIMTT
jgi:hypothetical protein